MSVEIDREMTTYSQLATKTVSAIAPAVQHRLTASSFILYQTKQNLVTNLRLLSFLWSQKRKINHKCNRIGHNFEPCYCGIAFWSSYYFATQVYTDCKIFVEKWSFMQIYSKVSRCSRRYAASLIWYENFDKKVQLIRRCLRYLCTNSFQKC